MKKIVLIGSLILTSLLTYGQEKILLPAIDIGASNNYIIKGTGDGGTLTSYNTFFRLHYGFAIGSPYTNKIGGGYEEKATIAFNARNGNITSLGSLTLAKDVVTKQNLIMVFGGYLGSYAATYPKIIQTGWNAGVGDFTQFYVSGNSSADNSLPKLTVIQNGNVGIGTTTPDKKLTVNGEIHAKEIIVDLNIPHPDYVFSEDYELKSLEEVENHIKTNGYLEGIPNADHVKENGLSLGELNTKLLEKVEELTLYMIQQNKETTDLKEVVLKLLKENEELKKEIEEIKK